MNESTYTPKKPNNDIANNTNGDDSAANNVIIQSN